MLKAMYCSLEVNICMYRVHLLDSGSIEDSDMLLDYSESSFTSYIL